MVSMSQAVCLPCGRRLNRYGDDDSRMAYIKALFKVSKPELGRQHCWQSARLRNVNGRDVLTAAVRYAWMWPSPCHLCMQQPSEKPTVRALSTPASVVLQASHAGVETAIAVSPLSDSVIITWSP